MSSTDTKSPHRAITELRFTQHTGSREGDRRNDRHFTDAADVIRFPEEPRMQFCNTSEPQTAGGQ